ncbi:hypothetical protein [Fusibacter sp. 3D3]|uniref:hypothetical protein n=1 Tax=Fusibacter sp. 3D3 TaxID=1048380 RepID=UPI0008537721|nr:hypothetical protein [Fusibacter sp. 3D3]GAU77501.1 hypothetical protein F3D3_2130 [Fusibacter sp. 3D3]
MAIDNEKLALQKIQYLHEKFAEIEVKSKVLERSPQLDMSTLLVSAGKDYTGREQRINLAYLLELSEEETNIMLLQFFTELPTELDAAQIPLIETIVSFINTRMPIGHFGIQNNKMHYRYVMVDTKDSVDHAMQTIETFFMYLDILDIFQESVESVISGSMTLDTLKAKF